MIRDSCTMQNMFQNMEMSMSPEVQNRDIGDPDLCPPIIRKKENKVLLH